MGHGLVRKRGPDLPGDRICKSVRIRESANEKVNRAGASVEHREIVFRRGFSGDANVPRVGNHTDDFIPGRIAFFVLRRGNSLSEHLHCAPVFPGHGFVDDDSRRYAFSSVIIEFAAADQRDSQSLKIRRINVAGFGGTLFAVTCGNLALDLEIALHHRHTSQQTVVGSGDPFYSRD